MTVSSPDGARPSARALAAWLRRRLPRRPVVPVSGACRSSLAFTRGTPPIFARTSKTTERLTPRLSQRVHAR